MSGPIRVLFHIDSLGIGGLEQKVTQLALRLDRRQFAPVVSYSWQWGVHGDTLERAGVPVLRIAPQRENRWGADEAVQQIREVNADIFHTFSCRQNAYDVLAAHRAQTPVIVSARDNVRHWAKPGPPRNWEFDRNRLTHFVTPCCQAAADLCRNVEGIYEGKIAVIPNGVELPRQFEDPSLRESLTLGPDVFLIGYAAKYISLKGHKNLLRAMRKVVERSPDVHLVCCGEDSEGEKESLQELAVSLQLERHVSLLGPRACMDCFYRGLDLYVHPSTSEALSMAILEAMSHGLPVVATSVGGAAEAVIEQSTGLLVPPSDPRALADAVLELAGLPEARRRMGTAGRERVAQNFAVDGMVRSYEALYARALEAPAVAVGAAAAAPLLTGSDGCPELADTTVFVTTIGDEPNFSNCLARLREQTVRCRIEIIDHVAPMSAAFALMHERCATPYYVQVDEDMLLYPHAIAALHDALLQSPADAPLVCAPLWDCDAEMAILGVKIYRLEIVRQFPYHSSVSCEVKQLDAMRAAGFKAVLHSTGPDAVCLGDHGKHYSLETIFRRWQRLFHKRNQLGHLEWLEPWPQRLLERYLETRDTGHLYAALGAIAGIGGRAEADAELDWRDTNQAWQRMRYYFPPDGKSKP